MFRIRTAIAALAVSIALLPRLVGAQAAYDFRTFDAAYVLDASGAITITEDMDVVFNEPRHGLIWKVPVRYATDTGDRRSVRLRVLSVTDAEGNAVPFETSNDGDDLAVKIGDPDVTVTGPVHYRMTSVLERAWNGFADHDEFYWNVIGFDNEAQPQDVSATVTLPPGVALSAEGGSASGGDAATTRCFAGPAGSSDESGCTIARNSGDLLFLAREPMTIVIGVPTGAVRMPTLLDRARWFAEDNLVLGAPIVFFFLLFAVWWKRGRDPKGRGTIIAEYEPPQGMDAVAMGTLLDATVHPRDVTAGIVGLAVRGHLTIEPVGDAAKPSGWKLVKKDGGTQPLTPTESLLLAKLFAAGGTTTISGSAGTMKATFDAVANDTYERLAAETYFVRNPAKIRGLFYALGVGIAVLGWFLPLGFSGTASFVIVGLLFGIFGRFMPQVTQKGALAREQARGFKLFLETAERDRLKWQEKEGLFEQYLPYAIVFGVVAAWARVFAGALTSPPSWYAGTNWNPMIFSSSVDHFSSSVLGTAVRPASSGSSGFGGGGFSGGGFGGGGSSSW